MYHEALLAPLQTKDFEVIPMAPMIFLGGNSEVTMDLIQTLAAPHDQIVDLQVDPTEKGYLGSIQSRHPNHRFSLGQ